MTLNWSDFNSTFFGKCQKVSIMATKIDNSNNNSLQLFPGEITRRVIGDCFWSFSGEILLNNCYSYY